MKLVMLNYDKKENNFVVVFNDGSKKTYDINDSELQELYNENILIIKERKKENPFATYKSIKKGETFTFTCRYKEYSIVNDGRSISDQLPNEIAEDFSNIIKTNDGDLCFYIDGFTSYELDPNNFATFKGYKNPDYIEISYISNNNPGKEIIPMKVLSSDIAFNPKATLFINANDRNMDLIGIQEIENGMIATYSIYGKKVNKNISFEKEKDGVIRDIAKKIIREAMNYNIPLVSKENGIINEIIEEIKKDDIKEKVKEAVKTAVEEAKNEKEEGKTDASDDIIVNNATNNMVEPSNIVSNDSNKKETKDDKTIVNSNRPTIEAKNSSKSNDKVKRNVIFKVDEKNSNIIGGYDSVTNQLLYQYSADMFVKKDKLDEIREVIQNSKDVKNVIGEGLYKAILKQDFVLNKFYNQAIEKLRNNGFETSLKKKEEIVPEAVKNDDSFYNKDETLKMRRRYSEYIREEKMKDRNFTPDYRAIEILSMANDDLISKEQLNSLINKGAVSKKNIGMTNDKIDELNKLKAEILEKKAKEEEIETEVKGRIA